MGIARGLERRLEKLADGASASLFRGKMHPIDMASRLIRQLEFEAKDTIAGPEIPNDLVVRLNPSDIDNSLDRAELISELTHAVSETAAERGWRTVGPVSIHIATATDVPRGILETNGTNRAGSLPAWGQLIADDGSAILSISLNRCLIGRALDSDVRISNQEVSRHHVIIFRQNGATMIQDLSSSNGTYVNGVRLTEKPISITGGDSVVFGDLAFTYRSVF